MAVEFRVFNFTSGVDSNRNLLASDFPDLQLFGTPFIWQQGDPDRLIAANNGSGLLSIARYDGPVEPGAGGIFEASCAIWGGSGAYAQVGPALVDQFGNGYWLRLSNLQRIIIARLDYNSGDGLVYYNNLATVETSGAYSSDSEFKLRLNPATGLITGIRGATQVISVTDAQWTTGLTPGFAAQQGGAVRDRGIYMLFVDNAKIVVPNGGSHQASRATHAATGTVSAPFEPLKSVAAYNDIMRGYDGSNVNGVKRAYVARIPYTIASGAVSRLVVSFSAPYMKNDGSTALLDLPNNLPIESAALEMNGASVPVTFFGGVFRDRTILADDVDIQADEILPAAFGLTEFAPGQKLYVRVKFLHPAGVDGFTPFSERRTESDAGAQYLVFDPAATTVSSVDGTGPFTITGAAPVSQTRGYSPILLGEFVGAGVALVARGDSITVGEVDDLTQPNGNGWFQRMAKLFSTPPATLNLARSGAKSAAATADPRLTALYSYAHAGVILYGTNDFGATGTDALTATVLDNIATIASQMRARGVAVVGLVKLPPRTTGTFATEAGQTVPAGWGAGSRPIAFNAALDSGPGDFVVPMNSVRGTNVYKWPAGTSHDGVHPNATGHALMAAEAAPLFAANVPGLDLGALIEGTATHTATRATHAGAGLVSADGSSDGQAQPATHAGTGERVVSGTGTHATSRATGAATGERAVVGSSGGQAARATQSGIAERVISGTAAHAAARATAGGTAIKEITGSGEHQASRATQSAAGAGESTGTATHAAARATHAGTGERAVDGIAAGQATRATHTSEAERVVAGTASGQASRATGTAAGLRVVVGEAAHQANPATQLAAVERSVVGVAAHQATRATTVVEGLVIVPGTLILQAARATHTGTGEREVVGQAAHQAGPATGPRIIFTNTRVRVVRPRYLAMVV